MLTPRPALPADTMPLARLWHDGWHEAHADHVPAELIALRTLDSFADRLPAMHRGLRVAGPPGAPLGLCFIKDNELSQMFTSPKARGTGLARRLLADGEARMAAHGITRAFLLCVIENERAVRFYSREGWQNMGVTRGSVETRNGPFAFDLLCFEKDLPMIRALVPEDRTALGSLWHEAWHDAHAASVPAELLAIRQPKDFARAAANIPDDAIVAGPPGAPTGFAVVSDDMLEKLFVAKAARGTGAATALLRAAEARIARNHAVARLDHLPDNHRAARFYEREGWQVTGEETEHHDLPNGTSYDLTNTLREKHL